MSATDRYAPDVLACWAYWEALRRIGFDANDIFITTYQEAVLGFEVCAVILRTQCREFKINAAKLTRDSETFIAAWVVFGNDMLEGRISNEMMEAAWRARPMDIGMLPMGLLEKGFQLPGTPSR